MQPINHNFNIHVTYSSMSFAVNVVDKFPKFKYFWLFERIVPKHNLYIVINIDNINYVLYLYLY